MDVTPTRAFRYDAPAPMTVERLSDGTLAATAYIARAPMVIRYMTDAGERLELLPVETLLRERDAKTAAAKAYTVEHPEENGVRVLVSPENRAAVQQGHTDSTVDLVSGSEVKGEKDPDSVYLRIRNFITGKRGIAAFDSGQTPEVSPGYMATIDEQPGIHPTLGRYDAIQTAREYNHLAGTKRGRGGPTVRFVTDSADGPIGVGYQIQPQEAPMGVKVRLDSNTEIEMEPGVASLVSKFRSDMEEMVATEKKATGTALERLKGLEDQMKALETEKAELQKKINDLVAQADAAGAVKTDAVKDLAAEKLRADSIENARRVLGPRMEVRADAVLLKTPGRDKDGKSVPIVDLWTDATPLVDMQRAVILAERPTLKAKCDSYTADQITTSYDFVVSEAKAKIAGPKGGTPPPAPHGSERADADPKPKTAHEAIGARLDAQRAEDLKTARA